MSNSINSLRIRLVGWLVIPYPSSNTDAGQASRNDEVHTGIGIASLSMDAFATFAAFA